VVPQLPDGVCRILARGSQKNPDDRYQSADELIAELEALLATPQMPLTCDSPSVLDRSDTPIAPGPIPKSEHQRFPIVHAQDLGISPSKLARRRTALWIITAVCGLTVLGAVILYWTTGPTGPVVQEVQGNEALFGRELIKNPGCEERLVEGEIPSWQQITGAWGIGTAWQKEGVQFFRPEAVDKAELRQDVSVVDFASLIDDGEARFYFSGHVMCASDGNHDSSQILIESVDADQQVFNAFDSGTIRSVAEWQSINSLLRVPKGTRSIRIRLISTRSGGRSNDAYYDDLSLKAIRVVRQANET
jgi:hypothetical protein